MGSPLLGEELHFLRLEATSKDKRIERQLQQIKQLSRNFMDLSQKHQELVIRSQAGDEGADSVGALHDKIEKYEAIIARLEEKNTELKDKSREWKKHVKKLVG